MTRPAEFARRHWIPPGGLLFAQASHGASWILLFLIAVSGSIAGTSGMALAWVHVVVLGWFTMAALSILLHAVPAFTDLPWRSQSVARYALLAFAIGIPPFVASLGWVPQLLPLAGSWIFLALAAYLGSAFLTLSGAGSLPSLERAIARALFATLAILLVVAVLGLLLALFLGGKLQAAWIANLPPAHGNLGIFGWLSLLVFGVSARTVRPICGVKTRYPWIHRIGGSATLLGSLVLAAGLGFANAWCAWIGAILVGLGAFAYVFDVADILHRATVVHRPPQAFIAAAIVWLAIAVALGGLALAGRPFAPAFVFTVLIGWLAQMVNAHMLHIGVRLIATIYRGDDDETRPEELLDVRLEWAGFALFQLAVLTVAAGLALDASAAVAAGAVLGLAAWAVMLAAMAGARARAIIASANASGGS